MPADYLDTLRAEIEGWPTEIGGYCKAMTIFAPTYLDRLRATLHEPA